MSDLVGEIEGVRRRTRRESRGGAVPLALLGLLVACAAPAYAAAVRFATADGSGFVSFEPRRTTFVDRLLHAHPNVTGSDSIGRYWLVAAPLVFGAVAAYYVWRARRSGISIDGWRVAALGGGLFALLVAAMAFAGGAAVAHDGFSAAGLLNPFLVVAVAVLTLAWVERSVAILLAGVTFAVATALADVFVYAEVNGPAWEYWTSWGWATVILGGVLLLWSGIVAVVRRPRA